MATLYVTTFPDGTKSYRWEEGSFTDADLVAANQDFDVWVQTNATVLPDPTTAQ